MTTETRPNIILTGFMGTGKSTIGRLLAERLDYEWVDTDAAIEQRHGPIKQIFANEGERAFRDHERAIARELARQGGQVISTGGRLMLDPTNANALGGSGPVFCLTATVETIVARTKAAGADRPLLAGDDFEERITALLEERARGYSRYEQIATDGRYPEEVVDDLLERLSD
jgi:shikimate kinase